MINNKSIWRLADLPILSAWCDTNVGKLLAHSDFTTDTHDSEAAAAAGEGAPSKKECCDN